MIPGTERTDAQLLSAHLDGDREAFGELVTRHQQRAWSVALRTLGDRAEAEDALQDAFLHALRGASGFRGDAQVGTWLHRIVVNACLDRLRKRARQPQSPLPDEFPLDIERVEQADVATVLDVRAALAALPHDQRIAVTLVDLEDLSVAEAATLLGVAEGTIKSRCSRGRARLALSLGYVRNRPEPTDVTTPAQEGGV